MSTDLHQTVLLEEAVHALITDRNGTYIDCTYGRGGHSQAIADRLSESGRLLVIDRDQAAIAHAEERFADDSRVLAAHSSFSALGDLAASHGIAEVDGVLMDLGVSSPQLDVADRGFSFQQPGPLDMRMDQTSGETASEWLAHASEEEITDVLKTYGEERFARRIARKITQVRQEVPIETTQKLVEIVETSVPSRERKRHPATRTFQAIRIRVNSELEELETCLRDVIELLRSGGRLVVISFHSLEDRIVKRFFQKLAKGDDFPDKLPIRDHELNRKVRIIGKPVRASEEEIAANRRARSSIMRVVEKL
ncbi:MAG: 16S rRNA (cytosine(1402)-N(4))-methyltransferase RsmH [Proteobacteria bacterium]|nr:16S rRNA (cytosine(1402)-N(4))-methyltransferase RsmH [Pseudomonadota bacterium]